MNFNQNPNMPFDEWSSGYHDYVLREQEDARADRTKVLDAIKNCPSDLQYASPELRADREIVVNAVNRSPI